MVSVSVNHGLLMPVWQEHVRARGASLGEDLMKEGALLGCKTIGLVPIALDCLQMTGAHKWVVSLYPQQNTHSSEPARNHGILQGSARPACASDFAACLFCLHRALHVSVYRCFPLYTGFSACEVGSLYSLAWSVRRRKIRNR